MAYSLDIFAPRSYQRPSRVARAAGYRNFIKLWHRRAGKDRDAIAFILEESMKRIGNYIHIFPSLNQARRDVWTNTIQETRNGIEKAMPMLSIFPKEIIKRRNDSEMFIEWKYGGSYQLMGADDDDAVERLRGPNPIGIIFSEYGHGTKMEKAYNTLIPVIAENGGWMQFAYTPNGFNQGLRLWEAALANPDTWFAQKLTIDDTYRDAVGESGAHVVALEEIEQLRRNGIREEFIQQEFYCSFTGFEHGTIYGDVMMKAREERRIAEVPYIPQLPVGIILDLGQSDAMAVWFYQLTNGAVRFIDYWEGTQKDIREVARVLRMEKRYIYGRVVLPWDGNSARSYLEEVGFQNVYVCDRTASVQQSIETVRREFPRFYFDETKCQIGLEHLRQYSRKFDEDLRIFSKQPIHDQHSHAADALRTGIEGSLEPLMFSSDWSKPIKVISDFDVMNLQSLGIN